MKFLHVTLLSVLFLTACIGSQTPAPVVRYGTSAGEGSAGVHNVIAGDTLWSVSQRYDIVMRDIISYNDLDAPFTLETGQRLRLPPPREYVVRDGDTLYAVSRIFGVGSNEIARINDLNAPYAIRSGQVLRLPSVNEQADVQVAEAREPAVQVFDPNRAVSDSNGGAAGVVPARKPVVTKTPQKLATKVPARSSSKFLRPAKGKTLSSYGPKAGGLHNDGVNIAAARGSTVAAAENGVVVYVGSELKGSGNLILVRHADRWMSAYAHLDDTVVTRGVTVKRGQKIGTVGSTGSVSTPQLHFELRRGTQAVNPDKYIK